MVRRPSAPRKKPSVVKEEPGQLFQHSPLPMWVYDLDTLAFLAVNEAAISKYGYSEAEFLSMTIKDIRPIDEVPELLENIKKTKTVVHDSGEWIHRTKSGQVFSVSITSRKIEYANRPASIVIAQDISQQKNTELAVKIQEEQLHRQAELVANISDAIISTDLDFHILTWNRAAEVIYGWATEEVIGQSWASLSQTEFFGDDREKSIETLFLTGKWDGEVKQKCKDGHNIYIQSHVSIIRDTHGHAIGMVGVNRNITERKKVENALRDSEERFRAAFQQAAVGVSQLALDGRYLNVNQKYCELVGYSEMELIEHTHQEITHPDDVGLDLEKNKALIKGEISSYMIEKRLVRKEGGIVWVNLSVGIVRDEKSRPKYLVGVCEDISERKTRERELDALYQGGASLQQVSDPKVIARRMIELLEKHMEWHHAAVWLRVENGDDIEQLAYSRTGSDPSSPKEEEARSRSLVRTIHTGLAGWVIGHGQIVRTGDVNIDPRYVRVNESIHSGLYVPLKIGKDTIGCISAESTVPDAFNAYDERLLTTLAAQAAIALDNARLYQAARRSARRRDVLHRASREIAQVSQDPEKVYEAVYRAAKRLVRANIFTIALFDDQGHEMHGVFSVQDGKRTPEVRFPIGEGITGHVISNRKPLRVGDLSNSRITPLLFDKDKNQEIHSVLAVPIRSGDKIMGVISVQSYDMNLYNKDDEVLLEMLASYAGVAIQNADLFEQTRQRAQELEALVETGKVLSSTLEMQPLLENILLTAGQAIPAAEKGKIMLVDEMDRLLHVRAVHGYSDLRVNNLIFQRDNWYTANIIRPNQAAILEDPRVVFGIENYKEIDEPGLIKSAICAPLAVKGRAIGIITLENAHKKSAFMPKDLNLLSAFASSAAVTIENARLFDQTRRQLDELRALSRVSSALRTLVTRAEIIKVITQQISQVFSVKDIAFLYLDEPTHENVLEYGMGLWSQTVGQRYLPDTSFAGLVSSTGDVYISDNILDDPRMLLSGTFSEPEAMIGAPLIAQNKIIGSLWAGRRQDPLRSKSFSTFEVRLLTSIADIAANALYRVKLYEQTAHHASQMAAISTLGRNLAETANLEEMYRMLAHVIYDLLPDIAGLFISLFDKKQELITCVCAHVDGEFIDHTALPPIPLAPQGEGRQSQVIYTRQALIIDDLESGPPPAGPLVYVGESHQTTISALYVPMIANNRVVGVVQVQSYLPARFDEADAQILSLATNTAGVEIQNARLLDDTLQRAAQLVRINDLGRALAETFNLDEIYERLAQIALDLVPGSSTVFISLFDPHQQEIKAVYSIHDGKYQDVSALSPAVLSPPGTGTQSEAIHTAAYVIIDDLEENYRKRNVKPVQMGSEGQSTQSGVYIPMITHGKVIGVLQLQSYERARYNSSDAELLGLVANTAAVSIENARLYDEVRQNAEQLSKLNALSRELAATLSLPAIYHTTYTYVRQFLDCPNFGIYLFDSMRQAIDPVFLILNGEEIDVTGLTTLHYDRAQTTDGRVKALSTALPVIVNDLSSPLEFGAQQGGLSPQSAIFTPMMADRVATGLLEIQSYQKDAYSTEDSELLGTIANRISLSIQNAELFLQIEHQVRRLSALRTIDSAISSNTDLNTTLTIILDHVRSELRVDAADILLLRSETMTLEHAANRGFHSDAIQRASIRLGEGLAGKTAAERKSVFIKNTAELADEFSRSGLLSSEQFTSYGNAPLVSKGQVKGVMEIFHRTPLNIDTDWQTFLEMMANEAAIAIDNADLFNELQRSNLDLTIAYDATIEGWAQALELHDVEAEGHNRRVTDLVMRVARQLGVRGQDLIHIRRGSLLHDLGKMGIPDRILRKPGPLTEEEWVIMRQHPAQAYNLLSKIPYLRPALDIPYSHHEHWDGNGYPRKLRGEQIPLAARIFAVVDVYDALISNRPYRKALSRQEALEHIRQQAGKHFDPEVVEVFLKLMESG